MDQEIPSAQHRQIAESTAMDQRERLMDSFFVFVPGIGDFIAVALGFLRANVWWVAFWMLLGKALRYWVWMELVYKVQGAV